MAAEKNEKARRFFEGCHSHFTHMRKISQQSNKYLFQYKFSASCNIEIGVIDLILVSLCANDNTTRISRRK